MPDNIVFQLELGTIDEKPNAILTKYLMGDVVFYQMGFKVAQGYTLDMIILQAQQYIAMKGDLKVDAEGYYNFADHILLNVATGYTREAMTLYSRLQGEESGQLPPSVAVQSSQPGGQQKTFIDDMNSAAIKVTVATTEFSKKVQASSAYQESAKVAGKVVDSVKDAGKKVADTDAYKKTAEVVSTAGTKILTVGQETTEKIAQTEFAKGVSRGANNVRLKLADFFGGFIGGQQQQPVPAAPAPQPQQS